ncbi:hypothetical protein B0T22DRAFT_10230 [Podospora appendiculata]|uniref:Uncharacterized protein n=1 Tax=Podospora appendiculata TaxID=314037 RepID=A0AAE0XF99_9PEZI|nr:hypothetical protein B0T22DRAFT_10230 [Podospora appendiculata]
MSASVSPKAKKAAVADKKKKKEMPLNVTCKLFLYIDPAKRGVYNEAFATLARSGLPSSAGKWDIAAIHSPAPAAAPASLSEKAPAEASATPGKAFAPLSLNFRHTPKTGFLFFGKPRNPKDNLDNYEELFDALGRMVKEAKFKKETGLENGNVVTWSLSAAPYSPNMSRWVLPVPGSPIAQPGEKMEQIIYNLCRLKLRRKDHSHAPCGGMAVMNCIENQLYKQKQQYLALAAQHPHFLTLNGMEHDDRNKVIKESLAAMEGVDKALNTLIWLFEQHVGRQPPKTTGWKLTRALKNLLKPNYGAVRIDDKTVEQLKKDARRELEGLQRIAPLVAAHLRLSAPASWKPLKRVCDAAADGPERREMPEKMGLAPSALGNPAAQATALARVRGIYDEGYANVLARVEALNKVLGSEYVRRGAKLFKEPPPAAGKGKRGLRERLGIKKSAPPKPVREGCLVEDKGRGWKCDEFDEKC